MKKITSVLILAAAVALSGCAATDNIVAKTTGVTPQTQTDRKEVKGLGDWSGYVQGTPVAKSKFSQLKIGMSQSEVVDIVGYPTDQRGNTSAKALVPFLSLSGSAKQNYFYKGQGRLVFSNSTGSYSSYHLVGIEHDSLERGYAQ